MVRRQARFLHILVTGYRVGLASHLCWDILYYGDVRWLPGGTIDRLWLGIHGLLCPITPSSHSLRVAELYIHDIDGLGALDRIGDEFLADSST